MDTIDEVLATNALSSKYSVAIHAALSVGKKTLNRYYAKTDLSKTYRIAMGIPFFILHFTSSSHSILSVLHPRHKLNYFKNAKWEDDWIETARQLVRDEFDLLYNHPSTSQESPSSTQVCTAHSYVLFSSHHTSPCMQATARLSKSNNIFDNMAALAALESTDLRDELDRYLSSDPEHVVDAVRWWCDRRAEYPHLSRMAIDYLVIPRTSLIHIFISNTHSNYY